jgi:hypothetical protein
MLGKLVETKNQKEEIMKLRSLLLTSMLVFSLIIVGCSTDNDENHTAENAIGPEGGKIEISNEVSLVIPAGALTDTIDFTMEMNASPNPIGGKNAIVSDAFEIGPTGTNFSQPCTISIHYNESEIGTGNESDIKIYADVGTGWEELSTTVNEAENKVTATINHLSLYVAGVDTTSITEGAYANLTLYRILTRIDTLSRTDMIQARFDSVYDPCNAINPLEVESVWCNTYGLKYMGDFIPTMKYYWYTDTSETPEPFLVFGETYTYHIAGNEFVPNFTASIDFPTYEPIISSPLWGAIVSKSGFTLNWNSGDGSGEIVISMYDTLTRVAVIEGESTTNDGEFTFTSSFLSTIPTSVYSIHVQVINHENINANGIDSRSTILAYIMNDVFVTLVE